MPDCAVSVKPSRGQDYPAEVSVVASLHGLPDGPVRDAVFHNVLDDVVGAA